MNTTTEARTAAPAPAATFTDDEIRTRTIKLLAEILERSPESVAGAQRLRADLGMDSLNALEFLSSLSHEFKIDLEVEEAFGVTTLDEVVALVASRVRAR